MKMAIIIMILVLAFGISIFVFAWTYMDYKKQRVMIEGLNFRKEYGLFDTLPYISSQKAIKDIKWKKQKNTGLAPEAFDKTLTFIDYSEEDSRMIIRKRTIK